MNRRKICKFGLRVFCLVAAVLLFVVPGIAGATAASIPLSNSSNLNWGSAITTSNSDTNTSQLSPENGLLAGSLLTGDVIYEDGLAPGWSNWSWNTTIDFANSSTVHSGSRSIRVKYNQGWAGLYLHSSELISLESSDTLRFWINGGTSGGRTIAVALADPNSAFPGNFVYVTVQANTWQEVEISSAELGSLPTISGIVWQEFTGSAQPALYIDDIEIVSSTTPPPPPPPTPGPSGGPALQVDNSAALGEIPDTIYGVNFADEAMAAELRLPINRWGGNATTRYNWQVDSSNRGSDWFFENIPNPVADPSQLPNGSGADNFVTQNESTGTETLMTIPTIGWTPNDREYRCGFSVSLYGPQQSTDPWRPDCGNGLRPNGQQITGNNPYDTSIVVGPSFAEGWVNHLMATFGGANAGGVRYYALDNEPMLWHHTHRDVHPDPVGYDELLSRSTEYAEAIKNQDPNAMVMGPTVWGWTAYFYSAIDADSGNWGNPPDRNAHGGMPLVPWFLDQMAGYEQSNNERILDYLDLHFYPQAYGIALSSAGDASTQSLRLRSTRALWDPDYVDESWINQPVQLIPRMKEWVNDYYPGTKLAITEYNWGGLEDINGALTQADVLGIFGREGLDLATLWAPPGLNEPGSFAFRMYRNYDGQGGEFGDLRLDTASSDQGQLSVYAARRSSDGAVTIMIVNKSGESLTSDLALSGLGGAETAEVYRYSQADLQNIVQEADASVQNGNLTLTYPANSITLLVIQ